MAAFYTEIHTSQQFRKGKVVLSAEGEEYIYLPGVASVVAGDWVAYDELFVTTRAVQASQGPLAVAMAAVVASDFGWFKRIGSAVSNVLVSFADNSSIYTTSTAGSVDDSGAGAEETVFGAIGRSAVAAGQATIQINRPWKDINHLD